MKGGSSSRYRFLPACPPELSHPMPRVHLLAFTVPLVAAPPMPPGGHHKGLCAQLHFMSLFFSPIKLSVILISFPLDTHKKNLGKYIQLECFCLLQVRSANISLRERALSKSHVVKPRECTKAATCCTDKGVIKWVTLDGQIHMVS